MARRGGGVAGGNQGLLSLRSRIIFLVGAFAISAGIFGYPGRLWLPAVEVGVGAANFMRLLAID